MTAIESRIIEQAIKQRKTVNEVMSTFRRLGLPVAMIEVVNAMTKMSKVNRGQRVYNW
jgi:hypothetical protein